MIVEDYLTLDTDYWADVGVMFKLLEYHNPADSTAVQLVLEHPNGEIIKRTVPLHTIRWVDEYG